MSNNKESPKTPGGISKSLLTPCRRVGLSKKWRKRGCSPFISPLNAHNVTPERTEIREAKRKNCVNTEHVNVNSETSKELNSVHGTSVCSPISAFNSNNNNDITSTPCRNTQLPRKKAKVLSLSLKHSQGTVEDFLASDKRQHSDELSGVSTNEINITKDKNVSTESYIGLQNTHITTNEVANPIKVTSEENLLQLQRTESECKKLSSRRSLSKTKCDPKLKDINFENGKPKDNSPSNLTKECILVIQNKILKNDPQLLLFDNAAKKDLERSDFSSDVPKGILKKGSIENVSLNILNDDDFLSKQVMKKKRNLSLIKRNKAVNPIHSSNSSQSSQEDGDKRTILEKKTYEKIIKPQKAKSTGSITQKDIEDLKTQIEMKKKLLLAKTMSIDTKELRGLIKKWQKGCQDALMELLDLMKKKLPDQCNMGYAEILENLKIPCELVGYDSENDCFIVPDDSNVLLSAFKL